MCAGKGASVGLVLASYEVEPEKEGGRATKPTRRGMSA